MKFCPIEIRIIHEVVQTCAAHIRLAQKLAINKKSTIFAQSGNFNYLRVDYFDRVSQSLSTNCGFFILIANFWVSLKWAAHVYTKVHFF